MYNCNTDSLGLILGVEVFFSEGHCSGALCYVTIIIINYVLTVNSRHRYPWLCSLRKKTGDVPEHLCAVNLLSRPPGPAVLVGAAHCTYLCR